MKLEGKLIQMIGSSSHSLLSPDPVKSKEKLDGVKMHAPMAYYTKPIRMKVSPLRANVLNEIQVQLRNNKFDVSNSPRFILDGAGLYATKKVSERA